MLESFHHLEDYMETPHTHAALEQSLARYLDAWHEPDPELRRAHLTAVWAPDGLFVDPRDRIVGRENLLSHITRFRKELPGLTFEVTSGIELHHEVFRYSWQMRTPDGKVQLQAMDIGKLDSQGQIALLIGFFGPFPELPQRAREP